MMAITVSNVHHALQLDSFYSRNASMLITIIYVSINVPVNETVKLLFIVFLYSSHDKNMIIIEILCSMILCTLNLCIKSLFLELF